MRAAASPPRHSPLCPPRVAHTARAYNRIFHARTPHARCGLTSRSSALPAGARGAFARRAQHTAAPRGDAAQHVWRSISIARFAGCASTRAARAAHCFRAVGSSINGGAVHVHLAHGQIVISFSRLAPLARRRTHARAASGVCGVVAWT